MPKTITLRIDPISEASMEFIRNYLNETTYYKMKPISNSEILRRGIQALWKECYENNKTTD